jgi:hypothetical protein
VEKLQEMLMRVAKLKLVPRLVVMLLSVVVSLEAPKLAVALQKRHILELTPVEVFQVEDLVVPKLILVVPWVVVSLEVPKLVVASREMQEAVLELVPMQVFPVEDLAAPMLP